MSKSSSFFQLSFQQGEAYYVFGDLSKCAHKATHKVCEFAPVLELHRGSSLVGQIVFAEALNFCEAVNDQGVIFGPLLRIFGERA